MRGLKFYFSKSKFEKWTFLHDKVIILRNTKIYIIIL